MPTGFSRRRGRHTRQNSSDIEDARPTQDAPVEDDVSDDEQPRAPKVEKTKRDKGKRRAVDQEEEDQQEPALLDDDDDDDDDDDNDRINLDQFPEQPLTRQDIGKLSGLAKDWREVHKAIGKATENLPGIGIAVAEATRQVDGEEMQALDRIVKENIDLLAEVAQHASAIDNMIRDITTGKQLADVPHLFEEEYLEKSLREYSAKTSRQKYGKNDRYKAFREGIYEVCHPDEPPPALSTFLPREPGDDEDDEDDIEIGGVTQTYKCPITLTPLTQPVTSTICGHSFNSDALKELCRGQGGRVKCPTAGCNADITLQNCKPDYALAKKAKAHFRRINAAANEAADDDDDDEVID